MNGHSVEFEEKTTEKLEKIHGEIERIKGILEGRDWKGKQRDNTRALAISVVALIIAGFAVYLRFQN